jgi:hypothetical protein
LWTILGATVVLVAGGIITAVAVSFHYLHAPVLDAFGFGWLPPDTRQDHQIQAGPYSAEVTPARPGHAQTFSVDVENPSSVTQTILGLAYDTSHTAEPEQLTISTTDTATGDARALRPRTGLNTAARCANPAAHAAHGRLCRLGEGHRSHRVLHRT